MLIRPPQFEEEPEKGEVIYTPPHGMTAWDDRRRVELFLNVLPWKCECGLTNFGRNKQCAKWNCKKPRPDNWRPK